MPLGGDIEADEGQKVRWLLRISDLGGAASVRRDRTSPAGIVAHLRRDLTLCNTTVYAILSPTDVRNIPARDSRVRTPPMIRRIDRGSPRRSATTMGNCCVR